MWDPQLARHSMGAALLYFEAKDTTVTCDAARLLAFRTAAGLDAGVIPDEDLVRVLVSLFEAGPAPQDVVVQFI